MFVPGTLSLETYHFKNYNKIALQLPNNTFNIAKYQYYLRKFVIQFVQECIVIISSLCITTVISRSIAIFALL